MIADSNRAMAVALHRHGIILGLTAAACSGAGAACRLQPTDMNSSMQLQLTNQQLSLRGSTVKFGINAPVIKQLTTGVSWGHGSCAW